MNGQPAYPQPPTISGLEQYDPESTDTSLQNIELA